MMVDRAPSAEPAPDPHEHPAPTAAKAFATTALLSAAEVARQFGRTVRTLHNWERAGVLRPVRLRGRRFFHADDVEALLREGDGKCRPRFGSHANDLSGARDAGD